MNTGFFVFDHVHQEGAPATRPLARLGTRLHLSLVVAGPGLPPPRFAADTRPNAPSSASNYGFQHHG
ncbi:MAG: hypothetical protein ACLGHA_00900 [Gammaproteobacteria bacterium]